MEHDIFKCDCESCQSMRDDAVDKWESEAPEREQQTRERLDMEGYYDNGI